MAAYGEEIKKYSLDYYGGGNSGYEFRAIIQLQRADNTTFAVLYFYRDRTQMPSHDECATSSRPYDWCFFPEADYPRILDLLRNEKPAYYRYIPTLQIGVVGVNEPVGDGDLQPRFLLPL